jgi:plastocyanin
VQLRRTALIGAALAATASAVVAGGAVGSGGADRKPPTPRVTVADDFFAPVDVTVKAGGKVKWAWAPENLDTHDVVLTSKHPKDVKASDFHSSSGAIGIRFAPKFEVPGTYGFICTYHKTVMKMTVTVKK